MNGHSSPGVRKPDLESIGVGWRSEAAKRTTTAARLAVAIVAAPRMGAIVTEPGYGAAAATKLRNSLLLLRPTLISE